MKENNLNEYVEKLYDAALQKTGDFYAAEDIVQETLLAAIISIRRGNEPKNMWGWLVSVMSNKYCDWLRDKYRKPYVSFEEYPLEMADEGEAGYEAGEADGIMETVRRELGYLAKMHREVMIRYYLRGEPVIKIATDMGIPVGTVKSRLNYGRTHIKERVKNMEKYTAQSYQPDRLDICCAGSMGYNDEPFSLVPYDDRLAQNILILSYAKPLSETEIAEALGVPAAFLEPIVDRLVDGELMRRMAGGKVYTDFIIYTQKDRFGSLEKQLMFARENFDRIWGETEKALTGLRKQEWYIRHTEREKSKLMLHFLIKLFAGACLSVRDEVTGKMPFSEYPYRKGGGRWIAMANQYAADGDSDKEKEYWKYGIDGEYRFAFNNFRDTKEIQFCGYGTQLGKYPGKYMSMEYYKWLYEIASGVSAENLSADGHIIGAAEDMINSGILRKEDGAAPDTSASAGLREHAELASDASAAVCIGKQGGLVLDIPVLTSAEYISECSLAGQYAEKIKDAVHDALRTVYESGCVKLPAHLKNVPKWQQYMNCGASIPMAIIYEAMERRNILQDVDYPLPAVMMIVDK